MEKNSDSSGVLSEQERAEGLILKLNGLTASERWAASASRMLKPLLDETDNIHNGNTLINLFRELSMALTGRRRANITLRNTEENSLFHREFWRVIEEPEDAHRQQLAELFDGFANDFDELRQKKQDLFTTKTVSVRFLMILSQSEMWEWIRSEPESGIRR